MIVCETLCDAHSKSSFWTVVCLAKRRPQHTGESSMSGRLCLALVGFGLLCSRISTPGLRRDCHIFTCMQGIPIPSSLHIQHSLSVNFLAGQYRSRRRSHRASVHRAKLPTEPSRPHQVFSCQQVLELSKRESAASVTGHANGGLQRAQWHRWEAFFSTCSCKTGKGDSANYTACK